MQRSPPPLVVGAAKVIRSSFLFLLPRILFSLLPHSWVPALQAASYLLSYQERRGEYESNCGLTERDLESHWNSKLSNGTESGFSFRSRWLRRNVTLSTGMTGRESPIERRYNILRVRGWLQQLLCHWRVTLSTKVPDLRCKVAHK